MSAISNKRITAGMVGMGMIFDETYRPFFERGRSEGLYGRSYGAVDVDLAAVVTRTGRRAAAYKEAAGDRIGDFGSFHGEGALDRLAEARPTFCCVASPDDRHFEAAKAILSAGSHLLVEKPSVLRLQEVDELVQLAEKNDVLAKVVYHKLFDPDHKKLRTLVHDGVLQHVTGGYCSLLEPKAISGSQFAEWIQGRNPATYVACHYIKLIDFTFGGRLRSVQATGQRGLVGQPDGSTWDSVQLRMNYEYDSGREGTFDIHTSWVTPDNFAGYVDQEVQFRFDNGLWNGHARKRGVEVTIEGKTPHEMKSTINNHFNAGVVEPWGERSERGYGIEAIEQFAREVASLECGQGEEQRPGRLAELRSRSYNDLAADRQTVATVQALEAILTRHAAGEPDCLVRVNDRAGGLVLYRPGHSEPEVLYGPAV